MIKVLLFPKDTLPEQILNILDIGKIEQIGTWLTDLPVTKRGDLAYRMGKNKNLMPCVIFARKDDAIAFKLKFGL